MRRIAAILLIYLFTTFITPPSMGGDELARSYLRGGLEGGYTTPEYVRENIYRSWSPTVDITIPGLLFSFFNGNSCKGELNEYWRAYLGLSNSVPAMSPDALTEWDISSERRKASKGLPASEFYGTTESMNKLISCIADTLGMGEILRNYESYKSAYPKLEKKKIIEELYLQGKSVLEHPGKWMRAGRKLDSFHFRIGEFKDSANEQLSLGMLAVFGMKWCPEEGVLKIHDIYDFPPFVTSLSNIPVRPREMKIRSCIPFDPTAGESLKMLSEI